MLVLFPKLNLKEFPVEFLALLLRLSVISGMVWFWWGSDHGDAPLMLVCLRAPFLVLLSNNTLYPKCDWVYNLQQQLELASELQHDRRDTWDWGWKQLVSSNANKTAKPLM